MRSDPKQNPDNAKKMLFVFCVIRVLPHGATFVPPFIGLQVYILIFIQKDDGHGVAKG